MQPACREQFQACAGSQIVQKACLEGWTRDRQLCSTGGDHVLEDHQHSHVLCAKVLLQHDARRYWGTHASLGVQQQLLCSPEIRVKLRNGEVLH